MIEFDPIRLYIKNFMGHSESEIDFTQFQSAIILGKINNNDRVSNGAGKSTLGHAVNFVLFSKNPEGTNIDDVIKDGSQYCLVEFDCNIGGEIYRFWRKRGKKTEVKLFRYINNTWDAEDRKTNTQTEEAISDLLKINFKTFFNTILFSQGSLSAISEAKTGLDRRNVLKEPLNLAIYTKLQKISNTRALESEKKLTLKQNLVGPLGAPQDDIIKLNEQLLQKSNLIDNINHKIEQQDIILETQRHNLKELEKLTSSNVQDIATQLSEISIKKKILISAKNTLQLQIDSQNSNIDKYSKDIDTKQKELLDINIKLEELQKIIVRSEADINKDISTFDDRQHKGIVYIANLESDYNKYSKPLPEGSECDICFHELTDDYKERVIEDHKIKALELKNQISGAKDKLEKIKSKKVQLRQELKDLSDYNNNLEKCKTSINNKNNDIEKDNQFIKKIKEDKINTDKLLLAKTQELELLINKEVELTELSNNFNEKDINDKIIKLKSEISNSEIDKKNIINELTTLSSEKGGIEQNITNRTNDIEILNNLIKEIKLLEKDFKIKSKVSKGFSPTGIPNFIIHTILDDLQIEANKILQDIRPELSLKFSIEKDNEEVLDIIYYVNGKDRKYSLLSGGQKMYISFSLKLGLSIVIQKQLNINIKLLLLDETDQPLDIDGKAALINIIKKMQNKYKILMITHNSSLASNFSHAILVDNDGTGAYAKVVTDW